MKTLDEVIELSENILMFAHLPKDDTTSTVGLALHYLKSYQSALKQMEENQQIIEDAVRQRDAHIKALAELKNQEKRMQWIPAKYGTMPEREGEYLTLCVYRDGSTAQKIKLWKDYRFTSENKNVIYWMELPQDPEGKR